MRLLGNWSAAGTHEYKYTSVDKLLIESYLDGVIIGLAGFCIRLVWHEPCLQQVLVKTIPKSSNWGVICKEGGGKRIQKIAVEGTECDRAKEGGKTARQTNEEAKRNYSFFHFPATFGIKSMYWDPGWIFFVWFLSMPTIYWQHVSSHFPVLFTLSLMCSHFNVPDGPLESLHSFHGCPNLQDITQRWWEAANTHSDQSKKVTFLQRQFEVHLISVS